jgi:two-component system sensor histidine kinase UhpB
MDIQPLTDKRSRKALLSILEDEKLAKQTLNESEKRYRQLLDLAPIGIAVLQDEKIVFTNPVGLKLLGAQSNNQLIGKSIEDIIHPDKINGSKIRITKMMSGVVGLYPTEDVYLKIDGTPIPVEVIAVPIDYNGKPAIQVIVSDISDRKKVEKELIDYQNQLKELTQYLQTAREEEREAIAREIHDDFGQVLTSLKMNLTFHKKNFSKPNAILKKEDFLSDLDSMTETIDSTIKKLRKLITELRPEVLDKLGLIAALEWQTNEFIDNKKIKCSFHTQFEEIHLNKNAEISMFRILQESFTNIAKHAQATEVTVDIKKENGNYSLEIHDNGIGFNPNQPQSSKFGIIGMKERAKLIGGEVSISSQAGKGTIIKLIVPENL